MTNFTKTKVAESPFFLLPFWLRIVFYYSLRLGKTGVTWASSSQDTILMRIWNSTKSRKGGSSQPKQRPRTATTFFLLNRNSNLNLKRRVGKRKTVTRMRNDLASHLATRFVTMSTTRAELFIVPQSKTLFPFNQYKQAQAPPPFPG